MQKPKKIRKKALTVIELLSVILILGLLFAAIFQALIAGQLANVLGLEKIYLQTDTRRLLDWLVKDLRSTQASEFSDNTSINYIRFRKVKGYNTSATNYIWEDNYTEYSYDNLTQTITRRIINVTTGNITGSWTFYNISAAPFYTRNSTGSINPLDKEGILHNRNLVLNISSFSQKRNVNLTFSLNEEVRIRNP